MKIVIRDKKKKEIFVALFQLLKNCSSSIYIKLEPTYLHIQGMDKSHVCLFDIRLDVAWFSTYELSNQDVTILCFDTSIFYSIISTKNENQQLTILMNPDDADNLYVDFDTMEDNAETTTTKTKTKTKTKPETKKDFKKYFKIPLADDSDYGEMGIPEVEYDAEITLLSKDIADIFSQLSNFGCDIEIHCLQESVHFMATSITGEMRVDMNIDDLVSYGIVEDEEVRLTYSLDYLNKMCITNKLSEQVDLSVSKERPLKIEYDLGDSSRLLFFIASKIIDT
jgi:proliferating cell nuclear antigen